jgi:hypothetical protein
MRQRRGAGRELGHERALLGDASGQTPVLRRIHHVDAGAEHRDGAASGLQGAAVRGAVDPAGQPAHHGDAARGEIARQSLRQVEPERCGAARAHDGDPERVLVRQASAHPQTVRRGGYLAKMGGIFSVPAVDLPDRRRARRWPAGLVLSPGPRSHYRHVFN